VLEKLKGRARGTLDVETLAAALAEAVKQSAESGDLLSSLNELSAMAPHAEGLDAPGNDAVSPYLAWLPFSLDEALAQLGLTRIVNDRLRSGYYRDRLMVLTTQEKSASTLHEVALQKMQQHTTGQAIINPLPRALHGGPLAMAGHVAFHFGLLLHYPNGGVVRGEFSASPQNIWMIHRTLGLRTVVLTRHPADRLVALYCMRHQGLRGRMKNHGMVDVSEENVLSNLFSGTTKTLPANIGSLRHNLEWLESWVYPEAQEGSIVARYEDMVADPMKHFEALHSKLFATEVSKRLRRELKATLAASGEHGALQSGDSRTRSYSKGYSGKVGVWVDYLTRRNVDVYNDTVKRFLDYTPVADQLLAVYPDLLLDRSLAAQGTKSVSVAAETPDRRRSDASAVFLSRVAAEIANLEEIAAEGGDIQEPLRSLSNMISEDDSVAAIDSKDVAPRLAWMPHTLREALPFVGLSRVISKRLRDGFYKDRLVVLITQEKSSSTLHEVAIRKMLRSSGDQKLIVPLPRGTMAGPVSMAGGATFHPGMLYFSPNGGVLRGVFTPSKQNRQLLHEIGCWQVVLARHPADRLIAQYCMSFDAFAEADLEKGIGIVINNLLSTNLEWLLGWHKQKRHGRTTIIRYEDMIADRKRHFDHMHEFMYQEPMSPDLATELETAFAESGEGGRLRSGNLDRRVYKRGYSGKVGVWRNYMTPANVELFNAIVDRYVSSHPNGRALLDIYPDLRLSADELDAPPADELPAREVVGAIRTEVSGSVTSEPAVAKLPASAPGREGDVTRPMLDLSAVSEVMRTAETKSGDSQITTSIAKFDELLAADPLESSESPNIFKRLEWLPHTIKEGVKFVSLTRLASKRLKEGYYRERLVILATQEKSGSTMHAVAIRKMLRRTGGVSVFTTLPRQATASPTTMAGGTVFHPGMLLYFPNGGVCRGVFDPSMDNKLLMSEVDARRIVLSRHPADRLVAQYCMHLSATESNIEAALSRLMSRHLPVNLNWLAGWDAMKNDRQLLARYEDMFADRNAHFSRLHDFLYQREMSDVLAAEVEEIFRNSGEGGSIRSGDLGTRVYSRGYSGKIGVWRDYMTPANVELFNAIVDRFVAFHPNGRVLFDIYPNLRLNADELNPEPDAGPTDPASAQQAIAADGRRSAAQ
jgi:hypothetical protein